MPARPQRVAILGASGMLGRDLVAQAPPGVEVTTSDVLRTPTRVDITNERSVAELIEAVQPEVVINAAAYTHVDLAETERDKALAVNATAVGQLGRLCAARRIRVVHFGTDYVFDGRSTVPYREDSPTAPVNFYGETKLRGERALQQSGAEALIIRTQWLFGLRGKSFPRTMYERARRRAPTKVVNDQHGRPTFTVDLALATWQLILRSATGIYHATNGDQATWFDVATQVFSFVGALGYLTSCSTNDFTTEAIRPAFSVLDTSRVENCLGHPLPTWQNALSRFLRDLQKDMGNPAS